LWIVEVGGERGDDVVYLEGFADMVKGNTPDILA
jgi:hypothetical protein